jgi:hypothetical protein
MLKQRPHSVTAFQFFFGGQWEEKNLQLVFSNQVNLIRSVHLIQKIKITSILFNQRN